MDPELSLDPGPELLLARVQQLQEQLESAGETVSRDLAQELVSGVVEMYGAGLERILSSLFAAGDDGER